MAEVEDVLLRVALWTGLGAALVAAGAGVFLVAVWKPSGAGHRPTQVETAFIDRWKRLVVVAWLVSVAASIVLVALETALGVEGLRLGLLVVGGLVWLFGRPARGSADDGRARVVRATLGTVALVALLMSAALSGHARGSSLPLPNLLVALVHVAAAAAWVGGLVCLVAVAFPAAREEAEGGRTAILTPVVARFSDLAVLSVVAIVASGIYSAWMEIGGIGALTSTTYGLVFLAKLAAFLPVLALGAINNRWTKPRLVKAARERSNARSSLLLLRRVVALEVGLIAVVLALTVLLLQLSPPASAGNV